MSGTDSSDCGFRRPPPQQNLDRASELGFEALPRQSQEQLAWLGVEADQDICRVHVLDALVTVDLAAKQVTTADGQPIGPHWRILVLHYLAIAERPERLEPTIAFADLATARSYNKVYEGRTVGRLCATVGRSKEPLRDAADTLGGRGTVGGDLAFDFDVFPRLTLRLVWHAPDEEFPASATILLPANVESFFVAEDIVVLSERLISRLCGRPF